MTPHFTLNGRTLDPDVEHEIINDDGMTVILKRHDSQDIELQHNITEVHWKYDSASPMPVIAIESDINCEGETVGLQRIEYLHIIN